MRTNSAGRCEEEGSLLVELVVLTPVLFLFALAALAFGRVTEARQQVIESSRAAAQAAALMPNPSSARAAAAGSAGISEYGRGKPCTRSSIVTDTGNFYPGGEVGVVVTCTVTLSDLWFPGIPGSTSISVSTTAPIDPYRSVR